MKPVKQIIDETVAEFFETISALGRQYVAERRLRSDSTRTRPMLAPASVSDYRELARRRLPRVMFDYVDGGAFDEATLNANRDDLQRLALEAKGVARRVGARHVDDAVRAEIWRCRSILAPVGFAGMMARRAEAQAARAAEKAGIPFTLSTVGICPIEEVRRATTKPFWFQLYMMNDRGVVREIIARAAAANCGALVFTVDLPVLGHALSRHPQRLGREAVVAVEAAGWR